MANYLDDLKGKHIIVNSVPMPDRKNMEFIGTIVASDSQLEDKTTLEFTGGGGGAVDSVFGRTGVVVATSGDYVASLVDNDSGVVGVTVADALDTLAAVSVSQQTAYDGGPDITGATDMTIDLSGATHIVKADKVEFQGTDLDWKREDTPAKNTAQTTVADSGTLVLTLDISGTDKPTTAYDGAEYVVKVVAFDGGFWYSYTGIFEIINNGGTVLVLTDLATVLPFDPAISPPGLSVSIGPAAGATLPVTFHNDTGAPIDAQTAVWSASRKMPQ